MGRIKTWKDPYSKDLPKSVVVKSGAVLYDLRNRNGEMKETLESIASLGLPSRVEDAAAIARAALVAYGESPHTGRKTDER